MPPTSNLASAYMHLTDAELGRVFAFARAHGMRLTDIQDGVVARFTYAEPTLADALHSSMAVSSPRIQQLLVDVQRTLPYVSTTANMLGGRLTSLSICLMRRSPDLNFTSMTAFLRAVRHPLPQRP